jgi:hypothetical protein
VSTDLTEDQIREEQHAAWQAFHDACVALGYVPLRSSSCVPVVESERLKARERVAAARAIRLANELGQQQPAARRRR